MKISVTIIIFIIAFMNGCKISKNNDAHYQKILNTNAFIAWNEDTVHSCIFALHNNGLFTYSFKENGNVSVYSGVCKARRLYGDTLFLVYDKKKQPPYTTGYLVKEASGKGYIQYYTNGRRKEFLFFRPVSRRGNYW